MTVQALRHMVKDKKTRNVFIGMRVDDEAVYTRISKAAVHTMLRGKPPGLEVVAAVTVTSGNLYILPGETG